VDEEAQITKVQNMPGKRERIYGKHMCEGVSAHYPGRSLFMPMAIDVARCQEVCTEVSRDYSRQCCSLVKDRTDER
jgi:hypothetical protein